MSRYTSRVEELARDVDMLVFGLERKPPESAEDLLDERKRLRRELEMLRRHLNDLAQDMNA